MTTQGRLIAMAVGIAMILGSVWAFCWLMTAVPNWAIMPTILSCFTVFMLGGAIASAGVEGGKK